MADEIQALRAKLAAEAEALLRGRGSLSKIEYYVECLRALGEG